MSGMFFLRHSVHYIYSKHYTTLHTSTQSKTSDLEKISLTNSVILGASRSVSSYWKDEVFQFYYTPTRSETSYLDPPACVIT